MSDLIERQKVIDELISEPPEMNYGFYYAEKIKALPSAQPEPLVNESRTLVNDLVNDTISRAAAIEAVSNGCEECRGIYARCEENILALPSTQPLVIHCTDCEDWHERQSILGFAISEFPSAQPEIIHCKDCKYRGGLSGVYCDIVEKMVGVDSFCSWAERRADD